MGIQNCVYKELKAFILIGGVCDMKRFWLAVFFFVFCFNATSAVFAADGEPHSVYIIYCKGPIAEVPAGQVVIELTIRDEGVVPLKNMPFAWELLKDGKSTGKTGSGSTNTVGHSISDLIFDGLEDGGGYQLNVWVKVSTWTKDRIAILPFRPYAGEAGSVHDELAETDNPRPKTGDGDGGGSGCSAFSSGAGILALVGLLLKKRSVR
jgi:hypothetical protein